MNLFTAEFIQGFFKAVIESAAKIICAHSLKNMLIKSAELSACISLINLIINGPAERIRVFYRIGDTDILISGPVKRIPHADQIFVTALQAVQIREAAGQFRIYQPGAFRLFQGQAVFLWNLPLIQQSKKNSAVVVIQEPVMNIFQSPIIVIENMECDPAVLVVHGPKVIQITFFVLLNLLIVFRDRQIAAPREFLRVGSDVAAGVLFHTAPECKRSKDRYQQNSRFYRPFIYRYHLLIHPFTNKL